MKTKTQLQKLATKAEQLPEAQPKIIIDLNREDDETLPNGDRIIGKTTYDRISAELEAEY